MRRSSNGEKPTTTRISSMPAFAFPVGTSRFWLDCQLLILLGLLLGGIASDSLAAARCVNGLVPDWNQPYNYANPNGPGPDPGAPGQVNQWNDWCAPSSAANLAGHWADARGVPVADMTPFPGSTVGWAAGPSWQDYQADGFARPVQQVAAGPLPAPTTDIGWYMDTNRGIPYDPPGVGTMGGYFLNNPGHIGTYLKDIHVGLQNYLNSRYCVSGSGWDTGTAGKIFTAGLDPTGGVAQVLGDALSAFSQVQYEINRNHTLILLYKHWNIVAGLVPDLAAVGQSTESDYGGAYYVWGAMPVPPNAEDEQWTFDEGEMGLGHAVTAVGYVPAGDLLDPGPALGAQGLGVPTDWIIVHDNWSTTPRNVIIPFDWTVNWVANTIAYPDPGFLRVTGIGHVASTNAVISFTGIPGGLHDLEWKSEMTNSTWSCCVSNCVFVAGTMQVTNVVSSSEEKRFYRVKASY